MNLEKLEESVRSIVTELDKTEFVYQLLQTYDQPKASITRLKKGDYNLSKNDGEVLWKKKLSFRYEPEGDLHGCIDRLKSDEAVTRHKPRFIIVTDYETLLALDTRTEDTIDTSIKDLADHFDFFLPWAGMEKSQIQSESLADIKAAEKMGRLYEMILADNDVKTDEDRHALNIFLSRLLFCFFAEDTDIFESDQFTNNIASHTAEDGSDLQGYLRKLFDVLATEDDKRTSFPGFLREFPYVNGGLFCGSFPVPVFNRKSRQIIIECGSLNWKKINPDIFGSMMQAVVHTGKRASLGMHYTSVVNIMKVIEPLFLNELKEQLDAAGTSKKKLDALLNRLYNLRIFDPACGSGNFLIIAFKELCRLEIEIFRRLGQSETGVQMDLFRSNFQLTQFYGIELDDFAHETAKLSLWLAEHQMNLEFKSVFGATRPTLPLQEGGNIVCGNATQENWEDVCPKEEDCEVFILGNPPYLGARNQSKGQKSDMASVFENHKDYKDSDYVCCWYLKGVEYIQNYSACCGFVSTNSICQGEQVAYLWPRVLAKGEIGFAYKPFKWTNHAKGNAGVTCVILGIRNRSNDPKFVFDLSKTQRVKNISPYLHEGDDTVVYPAKKSLTSMPKMMMGNMPRDGGNLVLTNTEYESLVKQHPNAGELLRKYFGANEFLHSKLRWCVWVEDDQLPLAETIPPIKTRIDKTKKFRLDSRAKTTNQYANSPHKFAQRNLVPGHCVILPRHSSENRKYIPFGYLTDQTVVSDAAQVIYKCEPWVFAVLNSRLHMIWCRRIGGALESRIRYSKTISYNPFPFPDLVEKQKARLEELVFEMLDCRERYPELTLAQLYEAKQMPIDLVAAHQEIDTYVEKCYAARNIANDDDAIRFLLQRYSELVGEVGA